MRCQYRDYPCQNCHFGRSCIASFLLGVLLVLLTPVSGRAEGTLLSAANIILLSIPDAGGLRITAFPDNTLHIHVAGNDLPPTPAVPVVGFTADASGYANGGSATIQATHTLTNIFGTGLDIKILAGTKLTANTSGITLDKVGSSGGGVALVLPLKDSSGGKTEVDIAPLTIAHDGTLHIGVNLTRATNVSLPGGFSLSTQLIKVDYTHHPGSSDDEATVTLGDPMHGGVNIKAPIPGVLTQNPAPLTLHVDTATVNTDGQISFTGAKLSQTAFLPHSLGTQVASLRPVGVKRRTAKRAMLVADPIRIPLMKPADFVIIVQNTNDVSLNMENNVPTAFTLKCNVELPSSFSTTPGGSARVTATGVTLDINANGFIATLSELPKAYFKGFGVQIHSATLDLSETKSDLLPGIPAPSGGVGWEGIYLQQADLVLPESIKLEGDTASATPPDLKLTNSWIDNNGFTGEVTLSGNGTGKGTLKVEDFAVHLDNFAVSVQQSSLKKCDISGNLTISSLGNAPIQVDAAVADSGLASLHVKTGKISLSDFHAEMEIQNGTIQRQTDKTDPNKINTVLALSGNWRFTAQAPQAVRGLAVQVNDLLIGSDGQFALDSVWLNMPDAASLDVDVVTLNARKIGFGGIGPGKTPWVGFNGEVGVGGDLPIQASVDFDGLYIYKDGEIHVGRIGVDCNVKGIIHVSGYIEQTEGSLTRTVNQNGKSNINTDRSKGLFVDPNSKVDAAKLTLSDGTPLTILSGRVAIDLPILGGGGAGGEIEFLIARNSWFAMGSFSSATPLIPIGQTGLAIYGFGGGVGYNVTSEFPNATGIPARDYQVIPDVAAIEGHNSTPGGLPDIVALASIRLGSLAAPPPIWGDVTLKVDVGHLTFSLQGNCFLGETMTPEVPAIASQKSRVLSATLSYDVPKATFVASGYADLCLPKKETKNNQDNTLVHLYAPFAFKIGNYDGNTDQGFDQDNKQRVFYAKLGGPVDLGQQSTRNGVTAHRDVSISNPVLVRVRGLNPIEGAISVDVNRGQFRAALKVDQPFGANSGGVQSVDLSLATIKYEYQLSGQLKMIGWLEANVLNAQGGVDLDSLNAQGEFYVYASLTGKATHLNVNPIIGFAFDVPDIGISALLEADLSGHISTSSLDIHGQVYADLGFSVADHNFSLPFSKDITWPAL